MSFDDMMRSVFIQWIASQGLLVEWMDNITYWRESEGLGELNGPPFHGHMIDTFSWEWFEDTDWQEVNADWEDFISDNEYVIRDMYDGMEVHHE